MTTEELIAAGLPIDPVVEGAEHAAPPPPKMLVLLVAPEVAKAGKFNLMMMMKMSGMWMLMSAI
jgi:hypothetical protein